MEKGDPTVSVDLLVKSLLAMGANKESIAKAIDYSDTTESEMICISYAIIQPEQYKNSLNVN